MIGEQPGQRRREGAEASVQKYNIKNSESRTTKRQEGTRTGCGDVKEDVDTARRPTVPR